MSVFVFSDLKEYWYLQKNQNCSIDPVWGTDRGFSNMLMILMPLLAKHSITVLEYYIA